MSYASALTMFIDALVGSLHAAPTRNPGFGDAEIELHEFSGILDETE